MNVFFLPDGSKPTEAWIDLMIDSFVRPVSYYHGIQADPYFDDELVLRILKYSGI